MLDMLNDLMDEVNRTMDDQAILRIIDKLDQLRLGTVGADRDDVCAAILECRGLLTPAGRLRRAIAATA